MSKLIKVLKIKKIVLLTAVILSTHSVVLSSYGMEDDDTRIEAAHRSAPQKILPIIQEGVVSYNAHNYAPALASFQDALKLLSEGIQAKKNGEAQKIDFSGKVGKGTFIKHPVATAQTMYAEGDIREELVYGTPQEEYYYDGDDRSLEKGAANIADLAANSALNLKNYRLAAELYQSGGDFHASSLHRAPAQYMYISSAENFAAVGLYQESLEQIKRAELIARGFYQTSYICLLDNIKTFCSNTAAKLHLDGNPLADEFQKVQQI